MENMEKKKQWQIEVGLKETWIEKREKSIQQDILKREVQMISMKNVRKGGGPEGGCLWGIFTLYLFQT